MSSWENMKREHRLTEIVNKDCLHCGKVALKMCFVAPMTFCNSCMEKMLKKGMEPKQIFEKYINAHKVQIVVRANEE